MLLNSLVIENIRSYTHEEILFPRGISLFEGDIGSGKSTILMAIEFALFGLGSQKAESLLAKKSESGYVILEFSVDGEKYEIKRTLRRKSIGVNQDPKNSWIKIGDSTEPLSPSELKQRVLQILKFNEPADPKSESRIFRYAIFTPQEAMKEVLADSKKRLETIRKAFGIEDYSIAEANARELLSEIKSKTVIFQERFSNISNLESQIGESQKIISDIMTEMGKLAENKKELENKENTIGLEIKEMQEKNNERIKLKSKKESVGENIKYTKSQIEQIERNFSEFESELKQNNERFEKLVEIKKPETKKSIPDLVFEIKKFQKINDELIRYNSERKSILDDLVKSKDRLGKKIDSNKDDLKKMLEELEKEKKELEKFFEEIIDKQDKIKEKQIQKQTQKNTIEKEIDEFSQLGNACPMCKQEIPEKHHHTLVEDKQKQADALIAELKSITNSFFESNSKAKEIQTKLDSYEKEILDIQNILPGIEEYSLKSSKLIQIEAKIQELMQVGVNQEYSENPVEHLTDLKERLTLYENAMEQMKQIVERKQKIESKIQENQGLVEELFKTISEKELELEKIELHLEAFGNIDKVISEKETQIKSLRDEITNVSSILAASKERKNNEQGKIAQNEKNITESKKWEMKFKIVSQYKDWLESFFIPAISQIEKQVLLSIWHNFNEVYRRWYSILVEDPTKESRIDENFTPIVNQDGYEQEIGFLSGGEKTSIALAYRLTLNSLIRKETDTMKSNLLILDEPTDGFSKNQLGKIREVLDELKSEQIILVSHEKELETYVDNIFQISKQDGISKISRMS
ncbi:MAG TPA: SMC family ATPase [Nitrosarchaeum sp.]